MAASFRLQPPISWRPLRPSAFIVASCLLALAGCSTLSPDDGADAVQRLARSRIGSNIILPRQNEPASSAAVTGELLRKPLSAEAAVQIALLNNASLMASFAELGISEADFAQAGRLPNPRFSYSNRRSSDLTTIDRTLMVSVMSLLTMPLAQQVAGRQHEAVQLQVASEVVRLASDTRRAYFSAVASQESVRYFEQVKLAAEAAAELANDMARIGNFNKLAEMRQQVFHADAVSQLAKAKLAAFVERERLTRLLGVAGSDLQYQLPERLPELPGSAIEPIDAEHTALKRRLDVLLARRDTDATAANLGLSKATRFINVFEAGYTNESNTGEKRQNGYEIDIEIPLFDWGDAKLARAEATYMRSVHRLQSAALAAQSEVRASYQGYRTAYDLARHFRDDVVPLRKRIADENVLRYNGMLISVFELLADARDQIASVNAYIDALRDFWIAETDLQLALSGTSPERSSNTRSINMTGAAASGGH
ncbi:MAG: TolC family protein [Betaproteobacteria bacterium]